MALDFKTLAVEAFGVTEADLGIAQAHASTAGSGLGAAMVQRGLLEESQAFDIYSALYEMPIRDAIHPDDVDTTLARQLPMSFLKRAMMVPLVSDESAGDDMGNSLHVAVNDPTGFQYADSFSAAVGYRSLRQVLAPRGAILAAIHSVFEEAHDTGEMIVEGMKDVPDGLEAATLVTEDLLEDTSDAPVIKLVNHVISKSIKARASDIHFESHKDSIKVRYRIDGILYDLFTPPKWAQAALISRIKIMSKLDIAEKRLPQDGRFAIRFGNQELDVRVSIIPTTYGERVVLRLLNKSDTLLDLNDLGLEPSQLILVEDLIQTPCGMLLVTGPTGSGKTTSLYASLARIATPDINIITIEDPVEYLIPGISQIQVNPRIDLTFANGLRSVIRQDPDVILVGEIRDRETAGITVQSALTGHLVFSTLHTNDSASAITRLVDIGVQPFLLSSSLIAVVAQRLVRRLCRDCRDTYTPGADVTSLLSTRWTNTMSGKLYRAVGCDACIETGYSGRIGIFEIMELTESIKMMLLETCDATALRQNALSGGMRSLQEAGLRKVINGDTTVEEILRVTKN